MKAEILVVENDEEMAYLLSQKLQGMGYGILWVGDGVEALQVVQQHEPDLILLGHVLPRMDGMETCRRIRETVDVPIIMLSCSNAESDKVRCLELGADDYIAKPVPWRELAARISAVLRRSGSPITARHIVQVDDRLTLDRARREVIVDGQAVHLSAIEFKLLSCLLNNAGCVLTHQSLLSQVWGWEYADERDCLKVYIHYLRKKIETDMKRPQYIVTERGVGYGFNSCQ
jgi:two-component system KDP operon response regulator KdpE